LTGRTPSSDALVPVNGRRITKFIDDIVWHVQFKGDRLARVPVNQTATDNIFFIMWAVRDTRARPRSLMCWSFWGYRVRVE